MQWGSSPAHYTADKPSPLVESTVRLPPGWASKWRKFTAWRLAREAAFVAKARAESIDSWIVTSPHYLELALRERRRCRVFYYCSDDYAAYRGWGGERILKREENLVQAVDHSFFVSHALADRARRSYGVAHERVSVSANATEPAFCRDVREMEKQQLFAEFPTLTRPLVGVVGGINDRLDYELILRCCRLASVGAVVMVGQTDASDRSLEPLHREPKCVFTGPRPHRELPIWMQMLDVALIPYRDTPLNRACSPMRLFDHLASGTPIVSTDACEQVREFGQFVDVCGTSREFVGKVAERLSEPPSSEEMAARRRAARANLWSSRALELKRVLEGYLQ